MGGKNFAVFFLHPLAFNINTEIDSLDTISGTKDLSTLQSKFPLKKNVALPEGVFNFGFLLKKIFSSPEGCIIFLLIGC